MAEAEVDDKAWTTIKVDGVEGRYRVEDETIHIEYRGHEKTVEAAGFKGFLANAAAEGTARLVLGELIAEVGLK